VRDPDQEFVDVMRGISRAAQPPKPQLPLPAKIFAVLLTGITLAAGLAILAALCLAIVWLVGQVF
jgi:hypothetical protein